MAAEIVVYVDECILQENRQGEQPSRNVISFSHDDMKAFGAKVMQRQRDWIRNMRVQLGHLQWAMQAAAAESNLGTLADNVKFQCSSIIDTTPKKNRTIESMIANASFLIAIGEIFDNCIQYVLLNTEVDVRKIQCKLNLDEGTLVIEDNGVGCADPKEMLVIGSGQDSSNGSYNPHCASLKRYLCGTFCRYGWGSKVACNALGERYVISSKTRNSVVVRMVEEFKKTAWQAVEKVRSCDTHELAGSSFCKIEIEGFKNHFFAGSDRPFSQESFDVCLRNLLGIYFMYLGREKTGAKRFAEKVSMEAGQSCLMSPTEPLIGTIASALQGDMDSLKQMMRSYTSVENSNYSQIDVSFSVIYQEIERSYNLVDLDCCLNTVLGDQAKDCFPIYLRIEDEEDPECPIIVTGAVFYFPYVNHENTVPRVDKLHKHPCTENRHFMTFWMGRWLPYEEYVPEFMKRPDKALSPSQPPKRCFERTFGLLFVDRGIEPDGSKTKLDKGKKMFKKMDEAFALEDRKKAFESWVKECHLAHDEEVYFVGNDPKYLHELKMSEHNKITLCKVKYQAGDFVELFMETRQGPKTVGQIVRFLQEDHFSKNKPRGEVELRILDFKNKMNDVKSFKLSSYFLRKLTDAEWEEYKKKNDEQIIRTISIELQQPVQASRSIRFPRLVYKNSQGAVIMTYHPKIRATLKALSSGQEKTFEISQHAWPPHIVDSLTVADSYTLTLEPHHTEIPFDCQPKTFCVVPGEMSKISSVSGISNDSVEIGKKITITFCLQDSFNNLIDVKAVSPEVDIIFNQNQSLPFKLKFVENSVEIYDLRITCKVGKHNLSIRARDRRNGIPISSDFSITATHGAPFAIHTETDWTEHVNYSNHPPVNVTLKDVSGNLCERREGRLVVTSPDLLFANNTHWESVEVRKGICCLASSCTSSLFSCARAMEDPSVVTHDDMVRFEEILQQQSTPVAAVHMVHGFFQVGDCVVLDTEQELAVGDPRKTRPKCSFLATIQSIFKVEGMEKVGICVRYFSDERQDPRLLTLTERFQNLDPIAITSRCFVFHDSLRNTLDPASLCDNVYFCDSDEFPKTLRSNVDLLYEFEGSLLHRRLSVPLIVSRSPRRFTLSRSEMDLPCRNSKVDIKVRHGDLISDFLLVATDEANQPCVGTVTAMSDLKVETSWSTAGPQFYRTAVERACQLPPLLVQASQQHSISVFSCQAEAPSSSQAERRLFHYDVNVEVLAGDPHTLTIISVSKNSKATGNKTLKGVKAGESYVLEAKILDKNGHEIVPLQNQRLDERISFTFEQDEQPAVNISLYDDYNAVLQGRDACGNITILGSKLRVKNWRIYGRPGKGSLKLGMSLHVSEGTRSQKTFVLHPAGYELELEPGDCNAILCINPESQEGLDVTCPSMADYECDLRFYVADSSGNNLSSRWQHDLDLQVHNQRVKLEKLTDAQHGEVYRLSKIPPLPSGNYYPHIVSKRIKSFTFNITVNARNSVTRVSVTFEQDEKHLEVMSNDQMMVAKFAAKVQLHTEDGNHLDDLDTDMPHVKLYSHGQTIPYVPTCFKDNCLELTFTRSQLGPHEISVEFTDTRSSYDENKVSCDGRVVVKPGPVEQLNLRYSKAEGDELLWNFDVTAWDREANSTSFHQRSDWQACVLPCLDQEDNFKLEASQVTLDAQTPSRDSSFRLVPLTHPARETSASKISFKISTNVELLRSISEIPVSALLPAPSASAMVDDTESSCPLDEGGRSPSVKQEQEAAASVLDSRVKETQRLRRRLAEERQTISNSISQLPQKARVCQPIKEIWVEIKDREDNKLLKSDCNRFGNSCNVLRDVFEQRLKAIEDMYSQLRYPECSHRVKIPKKADVLGCVASLFVVDDPRAADIQIAISTAFGDELNCVLLTKTSRGTSSQMEQIRTSSGFSVVKVMTLSELDRLPDAAIPLDEPDLSPDGAYGRASQFVVPAPPRKEKEETRGMLRRFARHFFGKLILFERSEEAGSYFESSVQEGEMVVGLDKPTEVRVWDGSLAVGGRELQTRVGVVDKMRSNQYCQVKGQRAQLERIQGQLKDIIASCDKIEEDEGRLQELGMTTPERRGGEGSTADMMSGEATLLRKREDGQEQRGRRVKPRRL
ncbi:hypothetical protein GUITHDRAFT_121490 [Guillardia theta CCMP2712]|uniref:SMCHD1 ribosomal S5 domain-containing protein n=3 Tax=Guillardia theta TaxID=55529 RepID=L1I8Y8_GUITC|nr:hypothetical protein GUITHDRAFT_121490 [Guillardia theta CCMP2712]EKX32349.1 hypothetical protein GUITHDRAFT_121490 [Guillardia theta CCMP2712]|eukprot:XP_005819329.1 hypothetical protein GUITHDRAFT_121490 [Guillardia theta CCMP2712]